MIPQIRDSITYLTLTYKCCVMESETISVNLPGVHCFPYTAKQFCLSAPFTSSISIHSVKYLRYLGEKGSIVKTFKIRNHQIFPGNSSCSIFICHDACTPASTVHTIPALCQSCASPVPELCQHYARSQDFPRTFCCLLFYPTAYYAYSSIKVLHCNDDDACGV